MFRNFTLNAGGFAGAFLGAVGGGAIAAIVWQLVEVKPGDNAENWVLKIPLWTLIGGAVLGNVLWSMATGRTPEPPRNLWN